MFVHMSAIGDGGLLGELQEKQSLDEELVKKIRQVEQGIKGDFDVNTDGVLNFRGRFCVPYDIDLIQAILIEEYNSPYFMHPDSEFGILKVKTKHQYPSGLLQSITIPKWKWEKINMDFVMGLPLTPSRKDFVWVIVDRFLNSAYFLVVHTNYSLQKFTELYIVEIVRLHGVPVFIISDMDPLFSKGLQEVLGSKLSFIMAYLPPKNEDMLCNCVIEFNGSWEQYLPLVEFSYNNSFKMRFK
ncbi:integrase [Gossypium australe]|uniref:Integrase n=1 Tax=Gossypium australe TaxID=47621 RepID=A0A5B6WSN9_9ROSI|nr:integrase [Gossypium australe]